MKPVLLLIPGMLNTTDVWRGVAAELEGSAVVRVVDVTTQSSIEDMARDAAAVVADVPAGTRLVVAGHSMGGYVAIEMLTHAGRRPDAIALLSTSGRPESDEARANREKTIAAMERDYERVVQGIASFGTSKTSRADEPLMQAIVGMLRGVGPEVAVRQNRASAARADRRATLASLAIPALVVCGSEDRVIPLPLSEELAALIPGARLEVIDAAGHMIALESAQRLAALLRTLL